MAHPRATPPRATPRMPSPLDVLVDVAVARAHNERAAAAANVRAPQLPPLMPPRPHQGPASLPARLAPLPSLARTPPLPPARALLHAARRAQLPPLSRVASAPTLAPPPRVSDASRAIPIPAPRRIRDRDHVGSFGSSASPTPLRHSSAVSGGREFPGATRAKRGRRESYTRFTAEEEHMLLDGVAVYGAGNWKKILNSYHFHWKRTAVDLKDKYRNMTRARIRRAAAAAAASESSDPDLATSPSASTPPQYTVPLSPLSAPPVSADPPSYSAYMHANGHRGRAEAQYHQQHGA